MAEDNWWADSPFATATSAKAASASSGRPGRAKTTPQDMKELVDASARAKAERSAALQYAATEQAVKAMGSGPWKAKWLDMITPEEDSGIMDTIGAVVGAPARFFVSDKTMHGREHLKTVGAQTTLAGSQMMKGSSSDKDTALMRMAGVGPYKSVEENLRILQAAKTEGRLSQGRDLFTSSWISKYGSVANPAPRGTTYEQALSRFERQLTAPKAAPRSAPPSVRRAPQARAVYDMNGNLIK